MRSRLRALIPLLLMLVIAAACSGAATPAPATQATAKPRRPTFTPTAARTKGVVLAPTATRRATSTPAPEAATATATATVAATATLTPTTAAPAQPAFTAGQTVNVRGGPGTNYPVIGQVSQGQQFEITGKDAAGGWWQFNYNGDAGWVTVELVNANDAAANVTVAANIPPPPTRPPQPTAAPRPAQPSNPGQPAQPPAPTGGAKYANDGMFAYYSTQQWVTIRCRLTADVARGGIAGTLRITQNGGAVGPDQAFGTFLDIANTGMETSMQYIYNSGCKLELRIGDGNYTAQLVEGGKPVSDPINFTVGGTNREFLVRWKPR